MSLWLLVAALAMVLAGFLSAVGVLALMLGDEPPEKGVLSEDVYYEEFGEAE